MSKMRRIKPTIFISSTIRDLGRLRKAIYDSLKEAGYEVRAVELTGLPSDRVLNKCRRELSASNIVVLIIGSTYGSTIPYTEISITRYEFQEAKKSKQIGLNNILSFIIYNKNYRRRTGQYSPDININKLYQRSEICRLREGIRYIETLHGAG